MDTLLLEQTSCIDDLLPFTATRSVLDIRIGILTLREKWEMLLGEGGIRLIDGDLKGQERSKAKVGESGVWPANILPTRELIAAGALSRARVIRYPWDIFHYNAEALIADFELVVA